MQADRQKFTTAKFEDIYRTESSRVLATLTRLFRDLSIGEEATQEAFSVAAEKWPLEGIPSKPFPWLVSTGRFKTIDSIRKRGREQVTEQDLDIGEQLSPELEEHLIDDDQLRLIFYCCHPSLPLDSRIALALKEVCGMKTDRIARAYLSNTEAVKKRISRAKQSLREGKVSYEIPSQEGLQSRVNAVLHVIYLIYNEGFYTSKDKNEDQVTLNSEAIFLARLLKKLLPSSETLGLLALGNSK